MVRLARGQGDELRENLPAAIELSGIIRKYGPAQSKAPDPDTDSEFVSNELLAEVKRAELIATSQDELDQIPITNEQSITDRVRKMMPDIGFPLQRSSNIFDIEVGNDNSKIASLNYNRIKQMTVVTRDDDAIRLVGNITRLDKDFGFGRFRPSGNRSALSFTIPKEIYYPNKDAFVSAFGSSEVQVQALPFRDGIGNISKLLIIGVI